MYSGLLIGQIYNIYAFIKIKTVMFVNFFNMHSTVVCRKVQTAIFMNLFNMH